MKHVAILVPALLIATEAAAISRYQTTAMSCARVVAVLDADGAVILRYPAANNPLIDSTTAMCGTVGNAAAPRGHGCSASRRGQEACQVQAVRVSGSGNR